MALQVQVMPFGATCCYLLSPGKTQLARATASQTKSTFFAVKTSDLIDKWLGTSENKVVAVNNSIR